MLDVSGNDTARDLARSYDDGSGFIVPDEGDDGELSLEDPATREDEVDAEALDDRRRRTDQARLQCLMDMGLVYVHEQADKFVIWAKVTSLLKPSFHTISTDSLFIEYHVKSLAIDVVVAAEVAAMDVAFPERKFDFEVPAPRPLSANVSSYRIKKSDPDAGNGEYYAIIIIPFATPEELDFRVSFDDTEDNRQDAV